MHDDAVTIPATETYPRDMTVRVALCCDARGTSAFWGAAGPVGALLPLPRLAMS